MPRCSRWAGACTGFFGNRDTDTEVPYDNLATDFPEGDIGGKVIEIAGLRIAGLAGVFKPLVWYPKADEPDRAIEAPRFDTREKFLAALDPREHWRGGLPLWHRDTIFPEDFSGLAKQRFDVLVSHEAPSAHRHGFAAIDRLAEVCAARLILHGHHHELYAATLANGIAVRGLAVADPGCSRWRDRAAPRRPWGLLINNRMSKTGAHVITWPMRLAGSQEKGSHGEHRGPPRTTEEE